MQEQEHGGATIEQTLYLQQILGTDKRNPAFTFCRDAAGQQLHVYYGAQVLQVVPADKSHAEFKLLVARLYNAGLKVKTLVEEFGVSRKTMKRWGDALKSGDPDRLVQALRGRGGHRKLTLEIQSYVRMRFPSIYAETRYAYSQRIRLPEDARILTKFGYTLVDSCRLEAAVRDLDEAVSGGLELGRRWHRTP